MLMALTSAKFRAELVFRVVLVVECAIRIGRWRVRLEVQEGLGEGAVVYLSRPFG